MDEILFSYILSRSLVCFLSFFLESYFFLYLKFFFSFFLYIFLLKIPIRDKLKEKTRGISPREAVNNRDDEIHLQSLSIQTRKHDVSLIF